MDQHGVRDDIAVIGLGCWYPGARDPRQFWENILARRQQFRRIPDTRFPREDNYDADPEVPDKTYAHHAALIDGFTFDWQTRRIPKSTAETTDLAHWLALEVALKAVNDAGFADGTLPKDRTRVVIGNSLTGEVSRANALRLRWPFIRRTLAAAAHAQGLPAPAIQELALEMETQFKSTFPPISEDSLAGWLANTIAGRICNVLDLHGGGYTVDGACASSLLAVVTAASTLAAGDADIVLAGGVDISLDGFELIPFAKAGVLAKGDMHVFDKRGSGFIPGEGCGFVVLKRLQDARRDSNHVLAVIKGWGMSSDGRGGLTAPASDGQARAIRRAYEQAGYRPQDLAFVEAHGTGTRAGDRAEMNALSIARDGAEETAVRACGLTSLKSIIGHTKAAAGIGSFIKTVIAVNQRVIPPLAGCDEPSDTFGTCAGLYPIQLGEILPPENTMRSAVSSMGFGGINCHVTIEASGPPSETFRSALDERALLVSAQRTEVFPIAADTHANLIAAANALLCDSAGLCRADMTDLAVQQGRMAEQGVDRGAMPFRAAIIASSPEDLEHGTRLLVDRLRGNHAVLSEMLALGSESSIHAGHATRAPRIGVVFPGQGTQRLNMARTLAERYEWARNLVTNADAWLSDVGAEPISSRIYRPTDKAVNAHQIEEWSHTLSQTEYAQPAICCASLLWFEHLRHCGIYPVVTGGHSLGELTALYAAGVFDARTLLQTAAIRGMASSAAHASDRPGSMASLACTRDEAQLLLQDVLGYCVIANINTPNQVVISGERVAVEAVVVRAKDSGVVAHRLKVSNAFHSELVASASRHLRERWIGPPVIGALSLELISGIDGAPIREGADFADYCARQILAPVDFVSLSRAMASRCDVLVEAGVGAVMSSFVQQSNPAGPPCFPVESSPGKDSDLNMVFARTFIQGADIRWSRVFENRLTRPFVPAAQKQFIENPCERGFRSTLHMIDHMPTPEAQMTEASSPAPEIPALDISVRDALFTLIVERAGYPVESLSDDLRLLDHLNLDSIKAGNVIAMTAKQFGVAGKIDPSALANAKLGDVVAQVSQAVVQSGAARTPVVNATSASPPVRVAEPAAATVSSILSLQNTTSHHVLDEPLPRGTAPARGKAQDYRIEYQSEAVTPRAMDWPSATVWVIGDQNVGVAKELCTILQERQATVQFHEFRSLGVADIATARGVTHFVVILPQPDVNADAEDDASAQECVLRVLKRLRVVATVPRHDTHGAQQTVAYVQFAGLADHSNNMDVSFDACSATAFASSLHFERPDLNVRVIDLPCDCNPSARVAGVILSELCCAGSYLFAAFDHAMTRKTPRHRLIETAYPARAITWSQNDVVLVTGGGKGITAECAMAFARVTGCKLALMGSSRVVDPISLFESAKVTYRYYQCDVTDIEALTAVCDMIQRDLGPITGVIHGAGLNQPSRIDGTTLNSAAGECAPKVVGALNLARVFNKQPPKIWIGLSSVIAVTGMPGNASYGFANEALHAILAQFNARHSETATLAIAFSVWDDVGMAVRLGSVEHLARMGVHAFSKQDGVAHFLSLVFGDPRANVIVVAGPMGDTLDTWKPVRDSVPVLHTVEQRHTIRRDAVNTDDRQQTATYTARSRLNVTTDLYLTDHNFQGSLVFPTVFGLEMMAHAARRVAGDMSFESIHVKNICLDRPIVVPAHDDIEIEVHAARVHPERSGTATRIQAGIRTEETGFAEDHFRAMFVPGEPVDDMGVAPVTSITRLPIEPRHALYGSVLFQGERFHRIRDIHTLSPQECVFTATTAPMQSLHAISYAGHDTPPIMLIDPYFLDALLHSILIVTTPVVCLPVHIEWLEVRASAFDRPRAMRCRTCLVHRRDKDIEAEIVAFDEEGKLTVRLTGYRVRSVETRDDLPTLDELANSATRDEQLLRTRLAQAETSFGIRAPHVTMQSVPGIEELAKGERHVLERPLIAAAVAKVGLHQ